MESKLAQENELRNWQVQSESVEKEKLSYFKDQEYKIKEMEEEYRNTIDTMQKQYEDKIL